jgi:hypothetical protein
MIDILFVIFITPGMTQKPRKLWCFLFLYKRAMVSFGMGLVILQSSYGCYEFGIDRCKRLLAQAE